jgi:hypothetical protein
MVSSITDETKEFIIHSNGEAGYVEVTSTSTLSEVRQLIIDEFDTEQLPSQSEEFAFKINGVRQSQKQETRKYAFELLEQQARVEIIPRVNNERKRKIDEALVANDDSISDNKKRLKIDASCAVTPFESSSSADNEKAAVRDKYMINARRTAPVKQTLPRTTKRTEFLHCLQFEPERSRHARFSIFPRHNTQRRSQEHPLAKST